MSGILGLGEMGALALHSMLEVTKRHCEGKKDWLSVTELAETFNASKHTLHKVVKKLVEAELMESSRGPLGGVRLMPGAEKATLLKILEAVEGDVYPSGCLLARRVCPTDEICQFCGITRDLENVIRRYFTNTTILDLAERLTGQNDPLRFLRAN